MLRVSVGVRCLRSPERPGCTSRGEVLPLRVLGAGFGDVLAPLCGRVRKKLLSHLNALYMRIMREGLRFIRSIASGCQERLAPASLVPVWSGAILRRP